MSEVNRISNTEKSNVYKAQTRSTSDGSFSSYLGETKDLDKIFDAAAEKYNVPVNLLKAIGKAESNFNPEAVSRCGAQGIMQLMPATARSLGVTDSFDPEQNIMGGAKYIASLLKKYDGNSSLALAAYNAGSGNVAKYNGIPPFKETQNYVKKVLGYMNQDLQAGTVADTKANASSANTDTKTSTPSVPVFINMVSQESEFTYDESDLESALSYDQYLLFLNKFLGNEEKSNTQENSEDDSDYFSAQGINYNSSVMNLIQSMNE